MQWGKQVRNRCCVQRLGLMKIPKGQGTARIQSVGTNTVDHSPKQRQRGAWSGGSKGKWVEGACSAKETGRELHDGLTVAPNRSARQAARQPSKDRNWAKVTKSVRSRELLVEVQPVQPVLQEPVVQDLPIALGRRWLVVVGCGTSSCEM